MAKSKVLETVIQISGEISPTLGKTLNSVNDKLSGVNGKVLAMAGAVGGMTVAVGKAALEAGEYLADLGAQFDDAADAIRIGTGATGEALDALMSDMEEVYKSVPTTMDAASQAIADYNTRLGLTGEDLQALSVQAIQVADMLGEDLGTVIETSSQSFQIFGLEADEMGESMDWLFKVSQSTGIGFNDLTGLVQANGAAFQQMGFDFNEAAIMLGQLEKAGYETSSVMTAMTYAVKASANMGLEAHDAYEQYYDAILNAKDETEAISLAMELFGARSGTVMAQAIRDGSLSIEQLTADLEASGETIGAAAEDTYDYAEMLQLLKQNAEVALAPMANTVFDTLNDGMGLLTELMEELSPVIDETLDAAMPFVEDFLGGGIDMLRELLPFITRLTSTLLPVLNQLMTTFLPVILDLIENLLPPIMTVVDVLLGLLSDVILPLLEPLLQLVTAILPVIGPLLDVVVDALQPTFELLGFVADVLGTIIGWIAKIVGWVAKGLTWVVDLVLGDSLGTIAADADLTGYASGGFTDGLSLAGEDPRYPVEAVISFDPEFRAENIEYWLQAGEMLGVTDGTYVLPDLPMFAEGGFTDGVSIAGEAGTEAVISFDPAYRSENLSYWAQAGRMLGADAEDYDLSSSSTSETYVDFGGVSFSPNIVIHGQADKKTIMDAIEEEYPEFIDLLEKWWAEKGDPVYA